jgi:hypothetical protein
MAEDLFNVVVLKVYVESEKTIQKSVYLIWIKVFCHA